MWSIQYELATPCSRTSTGRNSWFPLLRHVRHCLITDVSNRIYSFNSLAASNPLQKDTCWWHPCPTLSFKWQNTQNARNELVLCCCSERSEGSRYQTFITTPLKAGVNQGFGHRAAAFRSLADCRSFYSWLLSTALWIFTYVAKIYTFLLVKLILKCDNSTSSWRKNCTDGHNSDSKPTVKGSAARHFCSNEQQTGFRTSADATLDKDLASCQWRENRSKKTNNILNKDLNIAIPKASKHCRKWKYRNEELQSCYLQSRKLRVLWFSFSVWF